MLLLCAKPGFGVIIQAGSVLQLPFLGQLSIDIHDHGCVCVPHPGLQSLDLDAGFIACRAEGDTEIMTADLYVFPWRERLSFRQECFMLFSLSEGCKFSLSYEAV